MRTTDRQAMSPGADADRMALPRDAPTGGLLLAVHNPSTGKLSTAELTTILRRELSPAYQIRVIETLPDGTLAPVVPALVEEAAVILASGGDGTVSQVAAVLVGGATPLAILPSGTTNIIAQGLGIPTDPLAVCRLLRGQATTIAIDVAAVGDRYLLHMGGAGYDAHLMAATSRELKRGWGLGAYVLFGARRLIDRPIVQFTIHVDDRVIRGRGWMALVANGGDVIVRGVRIGPDIRFDDGLLDLCLFTAPKPWQAILSFLAILIRRYRSPYLRYARGRQIEIHADPPLPVEFDGDPAGTTPFRAEVLPRALTVLVPAPGSDLAPGPWLGRTWPVLLPPLGVSK